MRPPDEDPDLRQLDFLASLEAFVAGGRAAQAAADQVLEDLGEQLGDAPPAAPLLDEAKLRAAMDRRGVDPARRADVERRLRAIRDRRRRRGRGDPD